MLDILATYGLYFLVGQYPNGPLGGLAMTLLLASGALLLALPVGACLALGRVSPISSIRWTSATVVHAVRCTPLLMVIFWAYFLLPVITGQKTGQFGTMLAALVIFDGAYLAEIIRAGIQGLPKGQTETARSLGLSYLQSMRLVILPQAARNMLPSLVNQFVSTIKATSLGYIISLPEVSYVSSQIANQALNKTASVYGLLALTYFILCFGLSRFSYWLERHWATRSARV